MSHYFKSVLLTSRCNCFRYAYNHGQIKNGGSLKILGGNLNKRWLENIFVVPWSEYKVVWRRLLYFHFNFFNEEILSQVCEQSIILNVTYEWLEGSEYYAVNVTLWRAAFSTVLRFGPRVEARQCSSRPSVIFLVPRFHFLIVYCHVRMSSGYDGYH